MGKLEGWKRNGGDMQLLAACSLASKIGGHQEAAEEKGETRG